MRKENKSFSGQLNSNYKDGRTLKQYYCVYPGCNKKISICSGIYGKQMCRNHAKLGVPLSEEHKLNISKSGKALNRLGENAPNYVDGRTPITVGIRGLYEYDQWRKQIFIRDNYTCQKCGIKNGCGHTIILEAHHIKKFSLIFEEFLKEYNQFSVIEDRDILIRLAITYKPFWDLNNGKTLCQSCHRLKIGV